MPRRKAAVKREVLPDPKFGNIELAKFINIVMREGKKSIAEKIVYGALDRVAKKAGAKTDKPVAGKKGHADANPVQGSEPLTYLERALDNIKPKLELKARRVGGATYQVPLEVSTPRGLALARRWLVEAAKSRGEKTMAERIAAEILDACENRGAAVKKREDTHRMAQANKAFAHFNWN